MTVFSLGSLFAHWLAFLDVIQQFFWNYTPQPLLSTFSPGLIEDGSKFSPQIYNPTGYVDSVDITTICLVPTALPAPSMSNATCSIDHSGGVLDGVTTAETSHYCVFTDTLVPHEDAPPTSSLAQAEDASERTNMTSYDTRGLSFCPVLVGVAYIHSLLHLYMLLMIPSLFNHWFEDALVYDLLDPKDLLEFSWFFCTSFWIAPWRIFLYGTRKTIGCFCLHPRRVARKSPYLPIPRIVLIRIDGEAVPVNFAEDIQAEVGVSVWSSSPNSEVDYGTAAIGGAESQNLVPSIAPCTNSGIAEEVELPSMLVVSPLNEHEDEHAKAHGAIAGLGLSTFKFSQGPYRSPVFVEDANKSLKYIEEKILTVPVSDTFVVTVADSEEGRGDFQPTAVHDGTDLADARQMSLGSSCADGHPPHPRVLGIFLCDEDDRNRTEQISASPFDTSTTQTLVDRTTHLTFPAVLSEEALGDINMLTQRPTLPSPEQPFVRFPSLVVAREDVCFTEIDPIFSSELMESVVTRSPPQVHCPIMPAVVISTTSNSKEVGEWLTPSGTKVANQDVLDQAGTTSDIMAARGMLDIDPREHCYLPPNLSIEDLRSVDLSNVMGCTGSRRAGVQRLETSIPGIIRLPAIPEPRKDHEVEDRLGRSDAMTTTLSSQTLSVAETELLTMKPLEEVSTLPYNEAGPLATIPEVEKTDGLSDEKRSGSITISPNSIPKPSLERTPSGSIHALSETPPDLHHKRIDQAPTLCEMSSLSMCPIHVVDKEATANVTTENNFWEYDPLASIHTPMKTSTTEIGCSVSRLGDENHHDHRRSATTPVVESEKKPRTEASASNWGAVPDVVDAFRVFKEAPSSKNSSRRASSTVECTIKAPAVGVVGQKGVATNSLNHTCATADIQNHWINGSGLLIVRNLVPSDPAEFNLRTCTNLRTSRSHSMNAIPMQQVLHPRLGGSPHALHCSTVAAVVQRQQSALVPCVAELEHILRSRQWTAYRR